MVNAELPRLIRVAPCERAPYLDDVDALQSSDPARRLLVPIVSQAQLSVAVVAPTVDLQEVEASVNNGVRCSCPQAFLTLSSWNCLHTKHNNNCQISHYFSIVQNGHGAELTAGDVDHHFVLQAAADPTGRRLVGGRAGTHLARVVVAPCKHLNAAEKRVHPCRQTQRPDGGVSRLVTAPHLPVGRQGDGVVRAAGHLRHLLAQEVGGHEGGSQSVIGGPIAQLAVAVVAPSEDLPIYRAVDRLLSCCNYTYFFVTILLGEAPAMFTNSQNCDIKRRNAKFVKIRGSCHQKTPWRRCQHTASNLQCRQCHGR